MQLKLVCFIQSTSETLAKLHPLNAIYLFDLYWISSIFSKWNNIKRQSIICSRIPRYTRNTKGAVRSCLGFRKQLDLWRVYTSHLHMHFRIALGFPSTTFFEPSKVITRKTQRNVENACVNGMWQLSFTWIPSEAYDDFLQLLVPPTFVLSIKKSEKQKSLKNTFFSTSLAIHSLQPSLQNSIYIWVSAIIISIHHQKKRNGRWWFLHNEE